MDELVAVSDEPRGALLKTGEDRQAAAPECGSPHASDFALARQAAAGDLDSLLPPGYRTVFVLHDVEGYEHGEISRSFNRHRAWIQLVITDLMMPRLGGERLIEMVRRTDADLPIIVMTGWAGEIDLDRLLAQPRVALLRKPFQIEQLISLMADLAACGT